MSGTPKIESSDLSIDQVYKDFYVVPDYQREYVWAEDDVEAFAEDIYDEFYGSEGGLIGDVEYFIGSIVVCKNDGGIYELIDGQQRMTTIFLFMCAIRDFMRTSGLSPSQTLEGMIFANRLSPSGEDVRDYRLVLQYEDSGDVVETIAEGTNSIEVVKDRTPSIRHLTTAYKTLKNFLETHFDENPALVRRFFVAFVQRVKLIRIVTPNLSHALKVFETVNDRGVGLTAMDLLKNLLFMRTQPQEYPRLKQLWRQLTDELAACDEKHLRFLRYYVMASYPGFRTSTGKPLREDEIYSWFSKHAEQVGIDKEPISFARTLVQSARDYRSFAKGLSPSGERISYLSNIQSLSGKARQHFILMLAARHLPHEALTELARHVECLFFTFVITREPTKSFESIFGDWAKELRVAQGLDDVHAVVANNMWPLMHQKSRNFDFALRELTSDRIQKYRLKYILAKLSQYVDRLAWQDAETTKDLKHYLDGKLEIEHIAPQQPDAAQRAEFDLPDDYGEWVKRLGNLCLLEKPLNAAVSAGSFEEKLAAYRESKIVMTRAIASLDGYGRNNTLIQALATLTSYTHWSSREIEQRQEMIAQLSRTVWLMDMATEDEMIPAS